MNICVSINRLNTWATIKFKTVANCGSEAVWFHFCIIKNVYMTHNEYTLINIYHKTIIKSKRMIKKIQNRDDIWGNKERDWIGENRSLILEYC